MIEVGHHKEYSTRKITSPVHHAAIAGELLQRIPAGMADYVDREGLPKWMN
jgi:hypothetical protein